MYIFTLFLLLYCYASTPQKICIIYRGNDACPRACACERGVGLGWLRVVGLVVGGSTIERDRARLLGAGLSGTPAAGRRSRWEPGAEREGSAARASRSAATASRWGSGDKQGAGVLHVSPFLIRGGLVFGRGIFGRLVVFQDRVDCIFLDFGVFSLIWPRFLPITVDYT